MTEPTARKLIFQNMLPVDMRTVLNDPPVWDHIVQHTERGVRASIGHELAKAAEIPWRQVLVGLSWYAIRPSGNRVLAEAGVGVEQTPWEPGTDIPDRTTHLLCRASALLRPRPPLHPPAESTEEGNPT